MGGKNKVNFQIDFFLHILIVKNAGGRVEGDHIFFVRKEISEYGKYGEGERMRRMRAVGKLSGERRVVLSKE